MAGGKGKASRNTPDELLAIAGRTGLDGEALEQVVRHVHRGLGAAEAESQRLLKFNYNDVVGGKNVQQNVFLQPGDTVVVNEAGVGIPLF